NGLLSQYVAPGTPPPPNALNGPFNNEMGHPVVPSVMQSFGNSSLQPFDAYGRGVGIDTGIFTDPAVNQARITGLAEQAAPPKTPGGDTSPDNSITKSADVPVDPLVFASLLKGRAGANFSTACDTGLPLDPGAASVNPGTLTGLDDSRADLGF